jgi:DNA modification methylase
MTDDRCRLLLGDCLDVMRTMPAASVDAVVTDPPYGLAFMGKKWDYDVPQTAIWAEALRVLKPGGHLLAFFGTRTYHRGVVNIEDAGFEIRDCVMWVYGSGFPKSHNISAAIEKLAEPKAEPKADEVEFCEWLRANSTEATVTTTLGRRFWDCAVQIVNTATKEKPIMGRRALVPTAARWQRFKAQHAGEVPDRIDQLAKPEPQRAETPGDEWTPGRGVGVAGTGQWAGWGSALKPSCEPCVVARKPLEGTLAANVLKHGTGGINVDGCRVAGKWSTWRKQDGTVSEENQESHNIYGKGMGDVRNPEHPAGRWPANLIHDGSDEVVGLFPETGPAKAGWRNNTNQGHEGWSGGTIRSGPLYSGHEDAGGSAARFFYTAKAAKSERGKGNTHPTVKPLDLMAYLCRLVTPPGGTVLDPFMGSGTTIKAALSEGFRAIGIERDPDYYRMAEQRLHGAQIGLPLHTTTDTTP